VNLTETQSALQAAERARNNERVNELERVIADMAETSPVECPVESFFLDGMYSRRITMPKGTLLTSKIHARDNFYFVLTGMVSVWTEDGGVVNITAPYAGITKAGTRRIIFVHEECIWQTVHHCHETEMDKVEADLIYPHDIPRGKLQ
jgi:mannose-6-phosphate isomerase-like protein (cupin superfamily)